MFHKVELKLTVLLGDEGSPPTIDTKTKFADVKSLMACDLRMFLRGYRLRSELTYLVNSTTRLSEQTALMREYEHLTWLNGQEEKGNIV